MRRLRLHSPTYKRKVGKAVPSTRTQEEDDLEEGSNSLKFIQRIGQAHMIEPHVSALMDACNDYLSAKAAIHRAMSAQYRLT